MERNNSSSDFQNILCNLGQLIHNWTRHNICNCSNNDTLRTMEETQQARTSRHKTIKQKHITYNLQQHNEHSCMA